MNDIPYNVADAALCIADWFATADIDLDQFDGFAGMRDRILRDWAPWLEKGYRKAAALMNPDNESLGGCFDMEFVPEVLWRVNEYDAWDHEQKWFQICDRVFFLLEYSIQPRPISPLSPADAYDKYRKPGQVQDLQELFKEIAEKETAR